MTVPTFIPESRQAWRQWLLENHQSCQAVWLVYYKVKSRIASVGYSEAVDEALCFGWIDSKVQPIDQISYRQLFSVRKPDSVWSKVNKEKVAKLIEQGLMTEGGLRSIEVAKTNGSWTLLDNAENLVLPDALNEAFTVEPTAAAYFHSLSRTTKRNILQWIYLAKRAETIQRRIQEIVQAASNKTVPKAFRT